jgi:non-specific serine/threonine protein kinase
MALLMVRPLRSFASWQFAFSRATVPVVPSATTETSRGIELKVTPAGVPHVIEADAVATTKFDDAISAAFDESASDGLLSLAGVALGAHVEPGLAFAREWAKRYVSVLTRASDPHLAIDAPPTEDCAFEAMRCPPIVGAEYVTGDVLRQWWIDLDAHSRRRAIDAGGIKTFLAQLNAAWHAVGRVTFHLAENKRDAETPFAFLATFTQGVSATGKPVHVPLSRAIQQFAGKDDRAALLSLLRPVSDASLASGVVKELLDTQEIYQPLAWTPREAYRFLQDVPLMERSGLTVRVPDWWNTRRTTNRAKVSVRVGEKRKSTLGVDAMLDFSVDVSIGDRPLTADELQQLMQSEERLVQLRGQWVEVDREKLQQALAHWRKVEHLAKEGLDFATGMRLLARMPSGEATAEAKEQEEVEAEWVGIEAGAWLEETLSKLREPGSTQAPDGLRATLRPYQLKGYAWLRFMTELGLGACLADDMGLGKTVQVIALLLAIHDGAGLRNREGEAPAEPVERDAPRADARHGLAESRIRGGSAGASPSQDSIRASAPSLLVVPASLIPNWRAELAKFAPSLRAIVVHPSEVDPNDAKLPARLEQHDVVITTYGMITRLAWLRERAYAVVVLDEAQAIKNAGTKQSRAVREVNAQQARIALSGTPIENRLGDLWSLFDFLNPGLLGGAKAFGKLCKRMSDDESGAGFAPLRALVKPYILRRLKTDKSVISDLPDKTELKAFCTLTPRQAKLYEQSVDELQRALDEAAEGVQRQGVVLAYLMRFKQICNHPAQAMGGDSAYSPDDSGKFERLRAICEELAERQERVLVFTQFREMTQPIADELAQVFKRPGLILHGSTSVPQRKKLVEQFQRDDGPPFFVLSLKAGGTGLNLTAASNVIHFDRWWNPAVENQATDRAFRIGQKRNVLVHKFICRGTVEEKIDALIDEKVAIAGELLGDSDGAAKLLTEMSNDELLSFVKLDAKRAVGE